MRALVLRRQGPVDDADRLRAEDTDAPRPGDGELLLRVLACGVCHTDLHLVQGDLELRRQPIVPGHQIVGEVIEAGSDADGGRVGERVGVTWLSSTCGTCRFCESGRQNLCPDARFTGWDRDGGFAELVTVPAQAAHALPDDYDDVEAAPLLCAGVIGFRALRVSGVRPGDRLGLFGFGASAHLALQVARHGDIDVYVFTRSREHRRLARELGAAWVGSAEDDPPGPIQAAVTFAPVGWVAREALRVLDRGGTVAINAIHLDKLPELDYRTHLYQERGLRSVTNLTHEDTREFLRVASEVRLRTVVEEFPLEEANDVLRRMASSELDAAAALVP